MRLSPSQTTHRVNVAFQFTSQLLPPSSENACSKRNLVGRNRVSGAARTAFSVSGPLESVPTDNVLVLNRHPGFAPSFVDTEIGEGAVRTVVVGESGSISDLGTGSVVR